MSNVILKHWYEPFQRDRHPEADLHGHCAGVACGDEIDLYFFVRGGVIQDAFFGGEGCTICLGMASLLTQHVIGMAVDALSDLTERNVLSLAYDVEIPQTRRGCALTAFKALQDALHSAQS